MGFAASPATKQALLPYGIRESGVRWKWAPGAQGLTFPPHRSINGQFRSDAAGFDAEPGHDVNGSKCLCWLVPLYRTADGKIAKAGLQPIFLQPGARTAGPVVSSAVELYRPPELDLSPLVAAIQDQPITVNVTVPPDAIRIFVESNTPQVRVDAPVVNVAAPAVSVEAPTVNIEPAAVNVASPNINVEAPNVNVDVKPAPVKIIREKIAKKVRFRRNNDGRIETAEVTSE